jgi:hypothetical protein
MRNRSALCKATACGLVLLLGLPLVAFGDQASPGTVVEAGQSDALEAALKRHGWHVERDSDGGILLYLPSPEPAAEPTDPPPAEARERIEPSGDWVEARDLDGLQRALEAQGWRVQRSAEGDLLVFPVDPGVKENGAPQAPARDHERPPSATVDESSTPPAIRETGTVLELIDATDFDALQAAAADRGWGHRREADGSLVLLPPGLAPKPGEGGSCQIGMIRVSGADAIPLPVDTEAKAYQLAESWLREMDVSPLAIGRIRQVNRLFLVSVVEHEEPFVLHTQLVIRADDGCLMAIPR